MEKKDLHEKMRQDLIKSATKAVAEYGMEGAKTRAIASICNINESYIYRYYIDRDDLLEKAYIQSDHNFFAVLTDNLPLLSSVSDRKEGMRRYFEAILDYSTADIDYCKFYTRYYFSASFTQNALIEHGKISHEFGSKIAPYFRQDFDLDAFFHVLFVMLLGYLMHFTLGVSDDSQKDRDLLFEMIFDAVEGKLK